MYYLIISLSSIIIFSLIILFFMLLEWLFDGTKGCNSAEGYIKFKSFIAFYDINPNRWDLWNDYVKFLRNSYSFGDKYCFKFIDFYRYKFWKLRKKKHDANIRSNQKYQEMINILKQDIADFEKRNQQKTSRKLNEIWKEK